MIHIINRLVSNFKNESFTIDEQIPTLYLILFIFGKARNFLYGFLIFRRRTRSFVHPTATIRCASKIKYGKNLSVGRNCFVDALSKEGLICGDNVSMGFHTHIELTGSLKHIGKGMKIGNNVGLGSHGHYGSGIGGLEIGDDTIIGNYVSFHPENHVFSDLNKPIRLQGVSGNGIKVGKNCWIGAKATFLDGSEIGDGCVVAAGAVVKDKFLDNAIIGGIPAKILKYRK